MDADCFERVARALTAGISRPALASAFVGSLGVLGLQRRVEATAKELCPPCKKRKKGTCKKNKPDGDACPGGTYRRGRCAAAPVALGRCGTGRAGGEICDGGTCRVAHRGEAGGRVPSSSPGPSTMRTSAACGRAGAKCQARADAVGLDCTYKAWLSTVDDSPKTRFVHAPGPYRLVDGTKIADDWADLTDGTLRQAIDLDEAGNRVPARTPTWTRHERGRDAHRRGAHVRRLDHGRDRVCGYGGDGSSGHVLVIGEALPLRQYRHPPLLLPAVLRAAGSTGRKAPPSQVRRRQGQEVPLLGQEWPHAVRGYDAGAPGLSWRAGSH
jgi:hypothetical protein